MAKAKKTATPAEPTSLTVITKDDQSLLSMIAQAAALGTTATDYTIDSREMYELASISLTDIRDAEKAVEAKRKSIADPLHKAWKETNALFKPLGDALDKAKRTLSSKMVAFEDQERARIRAAEERAELERQQAVAEAEAKLAETSAKLATGEASLDDYQEATTNAMLAEVTAPITGVGDPLERGGGHARRDRWVVDQIVNVPDLLEYIAKSMRDGAPTFNNTVEFKLGQLNAFAQATSGSVPIPGVTFRKESNLAARGS